MSKWKGKDERDRKENCQGQDLWLLTYIWREKDEQMIIIYMTYAALA